MCYAFLSFRLFNSVSDCYRLRMQYYKLLFAWQCYYDIATLVFDLLKLEIGNRGSSKARYVLRMRQVNNVIQIYVYLIQFKKSVRNLIARIDCPTKGLVLRGGCLVECREVFTTGKIKVVLQTANSRSFYVMF